MDKKSITTFLFILLLPVFCFADQVSLAWDRVDGAEGYRIYARLAGGVYNYNVPSWQGQSTACTIKNLEVGQQYCFVARAYVGTDESGDSNEVCTLVVEHKVTPGKATGIRLSDD